MANEINFRGFTTVGRNKPTYSVTDFELVKVDLLNHFSTRLGERVMLPTFGCQIYDLLMDPLDDRTTTLIKEDAERIVNADPRVRLDDTQLTELLIEFLSSYKYNVVAKHTPEKGLEHLEKNSADAIILDIMLPGIDGFQALRKIREDSQIPVIMLTAMGEDLNKIWVVVDIALRW